MRYRYLEVFFVRPEQISIQNMTIKLTIVFSAKEFAVVFLENFVLCPTQFLIDT